MRVRSARLCKRNKQLVDFSGSSRWPFAAKESHRQNERLDQFLLGCSRPLENSQVGAKIDGYVESLGERGTIDYASGLEMCRQFVYTVVQR